MTFEQTSAAELLRRHGRSFHIASRFLDPDIADRATRLYAFCRLLDDLADEGKDSRDPTNFLIALSETFATSREPISDLYRSIRLGNDLPAQQLILALAADTTSRQLLALDELLIYCYGVAGTVGLMMADVLGNSSTSALHHALDLGIAMQLINISRDVSEDAKRERVYLPITWLPENTSPLDLSTDPTLAWEAVQKIISVAESYFESGFDGLRLLPAKSRRGIWIAGKVYREIGREILRKGPAALLGRTVVPTWRKVYLVGKCRVIPLRFTPFGISSTIAHASELHRPIPNLFGTNNSG